MIERCDECNRLVDGDDEGWHDHTIHGECNVCFECSDTGDWIRGREIGDDE